MKNIKVKALGAVLAALARTEASTGLIPNDVVADIAAACCAELYDLDELAIAIGIAGFSGGWQVVFYVGGLVPLVIVPLLGLYLPESAVFRLRQSQAEQPGKAARVTVLQGLFGNGSVTATLLLWVSYFFTLMVVYILINWLPSLLVGQGFTGKQASWVMFSLQIGFAVGTLLLGVLMDRLPAWALAALIYVGILASLTALGLSSQIESMLIAGFFATGGQCVLYAHALQFYRTEVRATGVGSAVAVGRLGAMSGPWSLARCSHWAPALPA